MLNRLADRQRRWVVGTATALVVLAIALLATPSTSAQEREVSAWFYGFNLDITIDGEPVEPGVEIVAFKGDVEIGRATVNPAGAWFLYYDARNFAGGPCDVTFIIGAVQTTPGWESCELRVRLVLLTTGDGSEEQETEESGESTDAVDDDQTEATDGADDGSDLLEEEAGEVGDDTDDGSDLLEEEVLEDGDGAGDGSDLLEEDDEGVGDDADDDTDLLEEEVVEVGDDTDLMEEEGDEVGESTEDSTTEQVGDGDDGAEESVTETREIIRPATPLTGSGSLVPSDQMPNWARAASITALLIFIIAVVALIFARRTDRAR